MPELWNRYGPTAARKQGKLGRTSRAAQYHHRHPFPCRDPARRRLGEAGPTQCRAR